MANARFAHEPQSLLDISSAQQVSSHPLPWEGTGKNLLSRDNSLPASESYCKLAPHRAHSRGRELARTCQAEITLC
jgi:hypothetical protein